jgi:hypothetical protein
MCSCKECKHCEPLSDYYFRCTYWNHNIKKECVDEEYCSRFMGNESKFQEFIWLLVFIFVFIAFLYMVLDCTGAINFLKGI